VDGPIRQRRRLGHEALKKKEASKHRIHIPISRQQGGLELLKRRSSEDDDAHVGVAPAPGLAILGEAAAGDAAAGSHPTRRTLALRTVPAVAVAASLYSLWGMRQIA